MPLTDDHSFARWLVTKGLLTKGEARRACEAQRGRMGRLDTEIIDLQLMSETAVLDALGKFHKTRTVSGSVLEFASSGALRMLTPRIASRLGVLPFKIEGKTLSVATLSPGDLLVEDEIAQQTGCMVASFVALEVRFVEALSRHYQAPITARYAGLIRRLSGVKEAPKPKPPRRVPEEMEAVSARPGAAGGEGRRVARPRASAAPTAESALELSAEELDLFPSMREDEGAADTDPGGISGAVPLLREGEAPPPPPTPPPVKAPPAPKPEPAAEPAPEPAPELAPEPVAEPPAEPAELGPEALLAAASLAMQHVEMRDDIADAMLGFCSPLFSRRMMLVRRGDTIMGWRGEGAGVDQRVVRTVSIPSGEPSVFSGLLQGVEFWLGPLPSMPHNSDLVMALGRPSPKDCYILPVRVRDKTVCFLYGDNQDAGVGGLPLGELKRLAGKAGLAFQVYLLKGKIRAS